MNICEICDQPGAEQEIEANARLIAAAPDMLEALENVREIIVRLRKGFLSTPPQSVLDIEKAILPAIVKAKGGTE